MTLNCLLLTKPLVTLHLLQPFFAQETEQPPTLSPAALVIPGLIGLLLIIAMWKIFSKAGQPGWASIIPIFNLYIWCKTVGRPGWWVLLMLIPFLNFIIAIILCIDMAKSFGKGTGFGIGIAFLGFIFLPILAFSSASYQGPAAAAP